MPRTDALNYVRRRDRVVEDDAWIVEFLRRAAIGVLATVENEQPFINSNLFVYDEAQDCLYMHTAKAGRTRTNIEQPEASAEAHVCFSIMEIGRLLPAATAKNFSVEYAGVVVFGTACVIEDPTEAKHALQLLMDKYATHLEVGGDYAAPNDEDLKTTAAYRITIESWSGKKKDAPGDFPGAYWYQADSMLASKRTLSPQTVE
ncbi:MAG TPA: pyridoxamine 5'-phosphate oxidase family protein [Phototrophicaceae bacterium]|jgi:hypothetical protein|nr:pyridoxamine 5'-phosphate oxidase family protein [Phototrophicaceae bacterium]